MATIIINQNVAKIIFYSHLYDEMLKLDELKYFIQKLDIFEQNLKFQKKSKMADG